MGCSCSHAISSSESACPLPASRETPNCIISCSECTQLRLEHLTASAVCSAFGKILLCRSSLSVMLCVGSVMHTSRIPGVESRLGRTWHRLNHNRIMKSSFQQCWTVKPEGYNECDLNSTSFCSVVGNLLCAFFGFAC